MCLLSENQKSYRYRQERKSLLSDKTVSKEKLTLIENDEIVESDTNTAQILNTFFSNIIINLEIAEYAKCDPFQITSTIQLLYPL